MKKESPVKSVLRYLSKWLLLGLLTGSVGGVVGTLFAKCITLVTQIRTQNGWLICLLPAAGLVSVLLYRLLHTGGMGTNQVIKSSRGENELSPLLTPAIFAASVISHLFGASVGREGAALQLGGSIATLTSRLCRLGEEERRLLLYCGMAGLFSAVFGTPFAAFAFALEVVWVGHICWRAVFPTLLSSLTAYSVMGWLGGHPERFPLTEVPAFSLPLLGKILLIAVAAALLAIGFCWLLHHSEHLFAHLFANDYLRIAVGGGILLVLTALVGSQEYNGAGVEVIHRVFTHGTVHYEAFLLKLLFTCVAVGAGFKGGEIVPTLFIGATFGGAAALLLGLSPALGAAVGMVALFCGVTNCPLAAILLGAEMFSGAGIWYLLPAVLLAFFLSGRTSLYAAQQRDRLRDILHK